MPRKLTLDDIDDRRAYERGRDETRREIIALKARRRVPVGPVVSLLFENRATVRYQIHEMARVERLTTDAALQAELDAYNPLIPERGELSATLFLELTDEAALRRWLPKLVGVERSVWIGFDADRVAATPEASHEEHLTRPDVTAAVHYVRFAFTDDQIRRFAAGATVGISHPDYDHRTVLPPETHAELLADLTA